MNKQILNIYLLEVGKHALAIALSMGTQLLIDSESIDKNVIDKQYLPRQKTRKKLTATDKLQEFINNRYDIH